jgi:hypothetical protein
MCINGNAVYNIQDADFMKVLKKMLTDGNVGSVFQKFHGYDDRLYWLLKTDYPEEYKKYYKVTDVLWNCPYHPFYINHPAHANVIMVHYKNEEFLKLSCNAGEENCYCRPANNAASKDVDVYAEEDAKDKSAGGDADYAVVSASSSTSSSSSSSSSSFSASNSHSPRCDKGLVCDLLLGYETCRPPPSLSRTLQQLWKYTFHEYWYYS